MTLQEAKDLQISVINENNTFLTQLNGFTFDSNVFNLSESSQIKWSNIMQLNVSLFPLEIRNRDNDIYVLQLANRENFYLTAVNGVVSVINSGNLLIDEINSMTDIDTVLNFSDNRL